MGSSDRKSLVYLELRTKESNSFVLHLKGNATPVAAQHLHHNIVFLALKPLIANN